MRRSRLKGSLIFLVTPLGKSENYNLGDYLISPQISTPDRDTIEFCTVLVENEYIFVYVTPQAAISFLYAPSGSLQGVVDIWVHSFYF